MRNPTTVGDPDTDTAEQVDPIDGELVDETEDDEFEDEEGETEEEDEGDSAL
jgi:hypothetical protein